MGPESDYRVGTISSAESNVLPASAGSPRSNDAKKPLRRHASAKRYAFVTCRRPCSAGSMPLTAAGI